MDLSCIFNTGPIALAALTDLSPCVSHNLAPWQHELTDAAFFATSFSIFFCMFYK